MARPRAVQKYIILYGQFTLVEKSSVTIPHPSNQGVTIIGPSALRSSGRAFPTGFACVGLEFLVLNVVLVLFCK